MTEFDPDQRKTLFQRKLEKLVHTELEAYRRKEDLCKRGKGCNVKTHTEWFEIDVRAVLEVVERWRKWIETGVYVDGKLDRAWTDKIERLVYVEGQNWSNTWNEWVLLVAEDKGRTAELKRKEMIFGYIANRSLKLGVGSRTGNRCHRRCLTTRKETQ